ncbi:MAG: hypothetical protein A2204_07550 [Elusimicrobia bacterium RIFOXYA1_FULL_47_7]|nr:MAG: hypothetical protein A2278_06545 [Elusimicrobia bacterium RIFOXYA12_FULL_49_49]OGS07856.1 MAG: hypothetical protein A2204_07550 [Elusimicrobia bacterium RIFOXYA1_FULL_47_7]OGS16455.1 MAG: hypothetical protein A2251_06480 [Elusimicrobia bacterium RIFOXYA2_FULL_47_53]OGS26040.1 MAG: hypothetical protein A2339_01405 [Elusimicrobia bacterium RIFOXYB12_FULL_50_12]OGS29657.1 MAG: hypothetical protein A2323_03660 [Elusimicrobia bacterium RIFOXYB2_FULL_46_23]
MKPQKIPKGEKMKKLLVSLLASAFVLFGTGAVFAAGLTYDGSTTIGENIMPDAAKLFTEKTGIKFDKIGGLGSGKGFKMVMEGSIDIGGVSRALSIEEKRLKPYYQIVGYDAIAVFINEKNPVKSLSKEQVKGIFTGKITNWKEVGGEDASIVVITEIKTGGRATIQEFKDSALDGGEFGPSIEIDRPHDCVKRVGVEINGITHASLAFIQPGAKTVLYNNVEPTSKNVRSGAYILSRPLNIVAKTMPKGELKKFFDFMLSPEGQAIVAENFVPVR